jgi:hypothetical protein
MKMKTQNNIQYFRILIFTLVLFLLPNILVMVAGGEEFHQEISKLSRTEHEHSRSK